MSNRGGMKREEMKLDAFTEQEYKKIRPIWECSSGDGSLTSRGKDIQRRNGG